MNIIYCYDAYCGWCYGMSPVMKKIEAQYKDMFHFEVLSGGLFMPEYPQPVEVIAPVILEQYPTIEEKTGIKFGEDYLWHMQNPDQSDWFPNSLRPAMAMVIFKELLPDRQVEFAHDLQYGLNFEGRDLTDLEAYRHLLEKYEIDPDDFYPKMLTEAYEEKAEAEMNMVKQLRVESYPQVFLQINESKFYLIAKGYTDYDTMNTTIQNIITQIQAMNN